MSQYIFIYGTLRPGLAPGEMARVVEALEPVGEASIAGVLYDLGEYPGAVIDVAVESRIFGTVYELPEDAEVIQELDRYEGFNPNSVQESLFVRVERAVELENGRILMSWIYVYNCSPAGARVLAGGRYRAK